MKTDIDILKWVRNRIIDTKLTATITGKVSDRNRPFGSTKEDVIISVLANEGCGDIQRAYVNVNIYVSDIWNAETQTWERDTIRVNELCRLSTFLFNLYGGDYRVSAYDSSQRCMPVKATFDDGHTEHLINNKLLILISNY